MRISEHKSEDSVKTYARRLNNSRKRNISAVFANHLSGTDSNVTCNANTDITKVAKSTPQAEEGNLVDFSYEEDIDDRTLSQMSANMLQGFNSFTNCQNMQFTFNVYINKK